MIFLIHFPAFSADLCPCLTLPEAFKSALNDMMDFSLLKDPVFLLIGISNVFGMAGLYVPFVYLVDAAEKQVQIYRKNENRLSKPRYDPLILVFVCRVSTKTRLLICYPS